MGQEKKLTERTLTGFLWMITGSGVQVVLKIGVLAVLARLVGPIEFGLMGIAVIVVEFSKMFTQMGVGPAIVQRKELEERHLTTGFTLSLFMGFLFAGLLALLAPALEVFFRMEGLAPVLRVTALIFLVDSLTLIGQALLQRQMKFRAIAAVDVVSYAIGYGAIGITLAFYGWGVWALVAAHMAQALLHAVLIFFIQPFPKRPGFELDAFKELLHFGGGMTMARIGNFMANQGDNLVVGRMLGAGALGIYGRAHHFMVMPASLFGTALDKALFPAMAKVQDDKQRLGKAYLTGVSIISMIALPLSIVLVLLAPEIIMLLLGPKWTEVILPFQILTCSLLFRMSYKMSDSLARATGAVYRRAWRQLVYAVLVVAGSYIGQFWGLPGVACGVAVALITNFVLMAQLSLGLTGVSWLEMAKVHWHGAVLGLTIGIAGYLMVTLCRATIQSELFILLICGSGMGVLLVLAIWRFPSLISNELKELFNRLILKRIRKHHTQNAWTS